MELLRINSGLALIFFDTSTQVDTVLLLGEELIAGFALDSDSVVDIEFELL